MARTKQTMRGSWRQQAGTGGATVGVTAASGGNSGDSDAGGNDEMAHNESNENNKDNGDDESGGSDMDVSVVDAGKDTGIVHNAAGTTTKEVTGPSGRKRNPSPSKSTTKKTKRTKKNASGAQKGGVSPGHKAQQKTHQSPSRSDRVSPGRTLRSQGPPDSINVGLPSTKRTTSSKSPRKTPSRKEGISPSSNSPSKAPTKPPIEEETTAFVNLHETFAKATEVEEGGTLRKPREKITNRSKDRVDEPGRKSRGKNTSSSKNRDKDPTRKSYDKITNSSNDSDEEPARKPRARNTNSSSDRDEEHVRKSDTEITKPPHRKAPPKSTTGSPSRKNKKPAKQSSPAVPRKKKNDKTATPRKTNTSGKQKPFDGVARIPKHVEDESDVTDSMVGEDSTSNRKNDKTDDSQADSADDRKMEARDTNEEDGSDGQDDDGDGGNDDASGDDDDEEGTDRNPVEVHDDDINDDDENEIVVMSEKKFNKSLAREALIKLLETGQFNDNGVNERRYENILALYPSLRSLSTNFKANMETVENNQYDESITKEDSLTKDDISTKASLKRSVVKKEKKMKSSGASAATHGTELSEGIMDSPNVRTTFEMSKTLLAKYLSMYKCKSAAGRISASTERVKSTLYEMMKREDCKNEARVKKKKKKDDEEKERFDLRHFWDNMGATILNAWNSQLHYGADYVWWQITEKQLKNDDFQFDKSESVRLTKEVKTPDVYRLDIFTSNEHTSHEPALTKYLYAKEETIKKNVIRYAVSAARTFCVGTIIGYINGNNLKNRFTSVEGGPRPRKRDINCDGFRFRQHLHTLRRDETGCWRVVRFPKDSMHFGLHKCINVMTLMSPSMKEIGGATLAKAIKKLAHVEVTPEGFVFVRRRINANATIVCLFQQPDCPTSAYTAMDLCSFYDGNLDVRPRKPENQDESSSSDEDDEDEDDEDDDDEDDE